MKTNSKKNIISTFNLTVVCLCCLYLLNELGGWI
jgi:hypothetical protein